MKLFKSHFWYTKSQRNGIFCLIILILIFQSIYFFVDFTSDETVDYNSPVVVKFQKQVDSLRKVKLESKETTLYPFNPNYISDYKAEKLGMTVLEIDRLFAHRKANKFINSKEEFQKVTKISDSLLNKISPFFKFPDWVSKKRTKVSIQKKKLHASGKVIPISTIDINKATAQDFKSIKGVGEVLSKRIIKYRSKLHGFSYMSQLNEVWGLEKEVIDRLVKKFKIIEKPLIHKMNVNTVTFKELLKNPYIDFKLCKKIFNYRDEVAELQNISELKNIKDFPLDLYDRIVLYLLAK